MDATTYRIFVTVTPELEPLLQQELGELGIEGRIDRLEGGLELVGDRRCLWRITLCSRLAESVRVRLGAPFAAVSFEALHAGLLRLPWAAYRVRGGELPEIRVTCRRSRLYHSGAVAQRAAELLRERLDLLQGAAAEGAPRIYLRLERDRAQVTVDASGELLHRRGYRLHVGQAPLRETLAAACLREAGYDGTQALWDPFCGAGTIPLEALAVATGAWPGAQRRFAFERWPTHDADGFARLRESQPPRREHGAQVLGSDIDADVLDAARRNARAAELAQGLQLLEGDFETVSERAPQGAMIVCNPPYGHRLAGQGELHRRFGALLARRSDLDPVLVLTGRRGFARATGLPWEPVLAFSNRGLPVRLLRLAR